MLKPVQRRLIDGLLALADAARRIQSAPPTPGIEALLIQRGDEPLQARVMARVIHICGERWARERTEIEKPLAGVLRRLADEAKATPPGVAPPSRPFFHAFSPPDTTRGVALASSADPPRTPAE